MQNYNSKFKIIKKTFYFLLVFLSFNFLLLSFHHIFAQDVSSITVYPTIQDIQVNPGEKTRAQVSFRNSSDTVATGDVRVADFIIVDKTGRTEIIEGAKVKPKYSASSWVKLSDDFIAIPKNETVTVNLFITPPAELTACGYYALVYFESNPGTIKKLGGVTESVSTVTSKIGAIVNFTTEGRICQESVSITKLDGPKFLEYGPISVTVDLLNSGDIHLTPKGTVFATNLLDGYVDQQTLKEQRIFPESVKEYQQTLGGKWMLGRYKVTTNVVYGQKTPKTVSQTIYVWVFPWRVATMIILTLIIVIFLIRSAINKIVKKEVFLEQEIKEEKAEIDKLRETLKRRQD